ncbi:hypothetical protein SCFA_890057 [anaerobic digester metagenome]|uniref:Uncharacterized protein n=1 Tax=anaerobic digester metagenome TaxID=1263854 RepID=A0A485M910_9ZZZZ
MIESKTRENMISMSLSPRPPFLHQPGFFGPARYLRDRLKENPHICTDQRKTYSRSGIYESSFLQIAL